PRASPVPAGRAGTGGLAFGGALPPRGAPGPVKGPNNEPGNRGSARHRDLFRAGRESQRVTRADFFNYAIANQKACIGEFDSRGKRAVHTKKSCAHERELS